MSGTAHPGYLPLEHSFLELTSGNCAISAVKLAEDENEDERLIIRGYETEGSTTTVSFNLFREAQEAYLVDINEKRLNQEQENVECKGKSIKLKLAPRKLFSIAVKF